MPVGILIMRWNERAGAELVGKYPEEVNITEKTLLQVYSQHESIAEAGMVSFMIGPLNIASYTTGPEKGYYIILLLNTDEDPDIYEDALADIAHIVLDNLEEKRYLSLLPSLFQRLAVFPSLQPEQKLALLYLDEVKRMVLQRLREEGAVSKSELNVWLKDTYREGFIDIESIVSAFVKEGLVKGISVKGTPSEVIFLTSDVIISRVPPVLLFNECTQKGLPVALKEHYINEIKGFFANYHPSPEDVLSILEVLADAAVYETFSLLRGAIVTRDDLEKLKKKGVDNIDAVLKFLWDRKMIIVLTDDKGIEYFALKSDILVQKIFPEYLVNTIRRSYKEKSKAEAVLLEHLNVLEEVYRSSKRA